MTELTPELLTQLEQDAEWFSAATFRWMVTDIGSETDANAGEHVARMLNAAPALISAAKERDHLRAEVERLRELGLSACNWLESSSDKAARRFYAARLRVEISKGAP